jgi:plastocyanin
VNFQSQLASNAHRASHFLLQSGSSVRKKALDTDHKFSFKFDKPGTYEYFCSIHEDDGESHRSVTDLEESVECW